MFENFTQPVIDIEYQNHSKVSNLVIKEQFAIAIGDVVTDEKLQLAINRVYALNAFEHVDAEFVDSPHGRKLVLVTEEKAWGPDYFSFCFYFQSDFSYRKILSLDCG